MEHGDALQLAIEINTEMGVAASVVALSDDSYAVHVPLQGLGYTRMKRAIFLATKFGVKVKHFDGVLKFYPKGR